ncbi:MAG: cell envelope integrity protein CreD [Bacteroidales bacterium]|nr:cell envelope integrity protein CreD [Bacteroidales bacterium]
MNPTEGQKMPSEKKNGSKNSQFKLGLKIVIIFVLSLFLLIPQNMILRLINERDNNSTQAEQEVGQMWSRGQTIVGPVIMIPSVSEKVEDIYLLPEELDITGDIQTQKLHKSIYDVSVYNSDLEIAGGFKWDYLAKLDRSKYDFSGAEIMISLGDLRGLTDNVNLTVNGQMHKMGSGKDRELGDVITCSVNLNELTLRDSAVYNVSMGIKGSKYIRFLPIGGATSVKLTSNCATPNFHGNYLPVTREVTDKGFEATWKVLALNSSLSPLMTSWRSACIEDSGNSWVGEDGEMFGVEMRLPVEQYQQNTRSIKYAYLIIALTFATVFFMETRTGIRIHPIQYLLVGIALLLYYTLLLSFSEHIAFYLSYIIASAMTIGLITTFLAVLLKKKKPALMIGGLLVFLYGFIYILLQMETYALLAGSIGLFVVLALAMFLSSKMKWY